MFGGAGAAVLCLAALVMVGWFTGQRTLVQVMPGWVPMQFNTALGFALCGGAMLAMVTGRRRIARVLAATVGVLAAATLSQMIFAFNLGLDNAFINHYITDATSSPGRMAPGTAIGFIVTAACMLLKTSERRELWRIILAQCLAALIGGMAISAVITYITGGDRGFLWGSLTEMAIHTAIGFTIISGAIVVRSWSHVESDDTQGRAVLVGLLTLCGGIFLIDSLAPLGIAVGVLYVVPLLLSLRSSSERDTIIVACVAVMGTVFGYFFFSPTLDAPLWVVLCNRSLAVLAIFMVTMLTVRIRRFSHVRRERDELTQAVDAMEQVMGVVGHELRTPLAAVRASAELVLTNFTKPDDDSHIFVQTIHDEIIRMAEMVNNLLEAARLNNGSARWNWGEVNVNAACDEAMSIIRPLLDHTRIDLTLDFSPPDLSMRGDAEAVRRLLVNFISNSAKHTSSGSIDITADATHAHGHDWVRLRIRDTGEGISENIREKLGRAFVLSSGVIGSDYVKGAGLGLSICRAIVGVHGGSIRVESEPGDGENEIDAAFTMGLLHDVGRMLLLELIPDLYSDVMDTCERLELPLEQVESRMLLVNHADLMDKTLRAWRFPKPLIDPIALHHLGIGNIRSLAPRMVTEVSTLALANRLSHALMLGSSGNQALYPIDPFIRALKIKPEAIDNICQTIPEETADVKFAMLSQSNTNGAGWVDLRTEMSEQIGTPLHPLFVSADPEIDAYRIFCDRLAEASDEEKPNVVIAHITNVSERDTVASKLEAAEQRCGVKRLPIAILSANANLTLDENTMAGRDARLLPSPIDLTRFTGALRCLLGGDAKEEAA